MSNLLEITDKVQRHLIEFVGDIELLPDGRMAFDFESTRLAVKVGASQDESFTYVVLTAPVAYDVPCSAELFKCLALTTDSYMFGHLGCQVDPDDDTRAIVVFTHTLLADYLDSQELRHSVVAVVNTADELDEEVVARFGGKRYEDV